MRTGVLTSVAGNPTTLPMNYRNPAYEVTVMANAVHQTPNPNTR